MEILPARQREKDDFLVKEAGIKKTLFGKESRFQMEALKKIPLANEIDENQALFKKILGDSSDVVFRSFRLDHQDRKALIINIKSIVETIEIDKKILNSLMNHSREVRKTQKYKLHLSEAEILYKMSERYHITGDTDKMQKCLMDRFKIEQGGDQL